MPMSEIAAEMLSDPFAQSDIYDSRGFSEFFERRDMGLGQEDLEAFEREALLQPLFRLKT